MKYKKEHTESIRILYKDALNSWLLNAHCTEKDIKRDYLGKRCIFIDGYKVYVPWPFLKTTNYRQYIMHGYVDYTSYPLHEVRGEVVYSKIFDYTGVRKKQKKYICAK